MEHRNRYRGFVHSKNYARDAHPVNIYCHQEVECPQNVNDSCEHMW